MTSITETEAMAPDWTGPLTPTGNLRRREAISRIVTGVAAGAAAFAVAMLVLVVFDVAKRGSKALSWGFVTHNTVGIGGGGIANALLGTAVIVAFAAAIATPVGVLTGLYLSEFAGSNSGAARILKLALDLLQGLPTIIVGLFIYGLIVVAQNKQTGFAGAIALSIVMVPLIARASQEVLALVPGTLRDAADALGVTRWRAVVGVILPSAAGGITTGAILAIARAAGETAPLLICDSVYDPQATQLNLFGHGVPSVPMYIFQVFDLPGADIRNHVWSAAFVMLIFILLANIGARVLVARSRRKLTG
jgi:phosphate transport system permease protein